MDSLFAALSVEVSARGVRAVHLAGPPPSASGPGDPTGGGPAKEDILRREAIRQLREYLQGRRQSFDLPLDLGTATPFRARVLEELRSIPFGKTASYGDVGRRIACDSPRAVGQAVGWNPLPILIPCHRVVTRAGRLGGFSAGLARKVALLRLEGIPVSGETFSSRIGG